MKKLILSDGTALKVLSDEGLWNIRVSISSIDEIKAIIEKLTVENLKIVKVSVDDQVISAYKEVLVQQPISIYTEPDLSMSISLRTKTIEEIQRDEIKILQDQLTQVQEAMAEMYEASIGAEE